MATKLKMPDCELKTALKKLRVYGKFMRAFDGENSGNVDIGQGYLNHICDELPLHRAIHCAFTWAGTDDGHDFWENIHAKVQRL